MVQPGTMNERLKRARLTAGYRTASDAINRFGWRGSTYRAHENGQNQFDATTATTYARAYGVNAGWLLTGDGAVKALVKSLRRNDFPFGRNDGAARVAAGPTIPVSGVVAAGVWLENSAIRMRTAWSAAGSFPPDPRFSFESQFDLVVEGTSLNRFAQAGDHLRCIDIHTLSLEVHDGDLVVIERIKNNALTETSVKRVRRISDRCEFWADSDDPLWQSRIIVRDGKSDENETVKVIGLVLWKYRSP